MIGRVSCAAVVSMAAAILLTLPAVSVATHASHKHWERFNHDSTAHFKIENTAFGWGVFEAVQDWNRGQGRDNHRGQQEL